MRSEYIFLAVALLLPAAIFCDPLWRYVSDDVTEESDGSLNDAKPAGKEYKCEKGKYCSSTTSGKFTDVTLINMKDKCKAKAGCQLFEFNAKYNVGKLCASKTGTGNDEDSSVCKLAK